jgi:hypothetical protein
MSTPVGAVQGQNAQKGVKRGVLGNPVGVPTQLPGFRGRAVDAAGPIKVPKLRNGNLNNETSNVRIPYNRVTPMEWLSSYQGRVGPGDILFAYKYPPGFVNSLPGANNATLGVNTLSRIVGLDGLNRLLMGSSPNGWRVGENVFEVKDNMADGAYGVLTPTADGPFAISTLNEYRLDGVCISNDEPGAFTSSGARDNVLFNVAIQGPVETNNGFLMYEDPTKSKTTLYNPLTGVTNMRGVEAHARGSAESGMHIENTPMPGVVGSVFQRARGKVDIVANFCGTYAMYPSQMFDRRVETLNTLYVGLRAYELSLEAKREVTTSTGEKRFPASVNDATVQSTPMYFYQYLPFSSRVAHVIQEVTDVHFRMVKDKIAASNGVDPSTITDGEVKAAMRSREEATIGRAKAAKLVSAIKQQTATNLPSAHFDTAAFDPVRSEDLWNMVGAFKLGRVLDTKAAVHERYAGGPRDTAFSCIVDVQIAWRSALAVQINPDTKADVTGFLLEPSERSERGGQQTSTTLANNLSPPLNQVIGSDFGRDVTPAPNQAVQGLAETYQATVAERQQEVRREEAALARVLAGDDATTQEVADQMGDAVLKVRELLRASPNAAKINELLSDAKFGQDPMKDVRRLLQMEDVEFPEVPQEISGKTEALWDSFIESRNDMAGKIGSTAPGQRPAAAYEVLRQAKAKWQAAADEEIKYLMKESTPSLSWWARNEPSATLKATLKKRIDEYLKAMQEAKEKVEAQPSMNDTSAASRANRAALSALLNRANIMSVLFCTVVRELGDRSCAQTFVLNTPGEDIQKALEDGELLDELVHFSAICDLHEKHFPVDEVYFSALVARKAAAPAPAPAPAVAVAPAPVAPVAATPAARTGAAAGAPKPRGKSKSPARTRPGSVVPTGASSSTAAPPAPTRPAVARTAPPAAAAGMTSTPLVPTQTASAEPVAPRRRAREASASDSMTNSIFENMFTQHTTDTGAEEPASPTPSSGSESGPRTFRRQR